MELERFKSKLSKGQLEAMAIDTVKKYMETQNPLDVLTFAKKLLHFSNVLVKESEKEGKMVWDNNKSDYPDMNYTSGGAIFDWDSDPVYASIKLMLSERLELLRTAVKIKEPFFDKDGIEVPKCPLKGYRKDSINVKI
jgi:hypothetical protein